MGAGLPSLLAHPPLKGEGGYSPMTGTETKY
jgi:hypothetical protein